MASLPYSRIFSASSASFGFASGLTRFRAGCRASAPAAPSPAPTVDAETDTDGQRQREMCSVSPPKNSMASTMICVEPWVMMGAADSTGDRVVDHFINRCALRILRKFSRTGRR